MGEDSEKSDGECDIRLVESGEQRTMQDTVWRDRVVMSCIVQYIVEHYTIVWDEDMPDLSAGAGEHLPYKPCTLLPQLILSPAFPVHYIP